MPHHEIISLFSAVLCYLPMLVFRYNTNGLRRTSVLPGPHDEFDTTPSDSKSRSTGRFRPIGGSRRLCFPDSRSRLLRPARVGVLVARGTRIAGDYASLRPDDRLLKRGEAKRISNNTVGERGEVSGQQTRFREPGIVQSCMVAR